MRKKLNMMSSWKVILLFPILFFFALSQIYAVDNIALEWDGNTEPDLAGYKVYYKTGSSGPPYNGTGATEGDSPINVGNVTQKSLSGLTDGVTYFIAITAYDNETPSLESGYSNEADTKAPQITSPPIITSMTDEFVTIDWHTDEPGNSEVQYQATPTGGITWGNYFMKVTDPSMVTTHSVTLTGLSVETQYFFRVGSTDAGGVGPNFSVTDNNPSAEYDFFINQGPDTDPPVITLPPTVISITDNAAAIEWQTDEPSTSVIQYDDNSSTWGNYLWSNTDTSLVTTHSVTLTGLLADTTYYFRVGSTDGFINGPTTSNEVTFITDTIPDTTPPIITTPPTVTGITKTSAIIEWQTDEPSNSVVEYGEEHVPPIYGSQATLGNYITNHSVTLSGLTAGKDYDFRVSSTDDLGNGPTTSKNYTFKTKDVDDQAPVITSAPTVTNITDSTAVIEWQTDEPSNSMVRYDINSSGVWTGYSSSKDNPTMVTNHSVTLTGLVQNQTYYFIVGSADAYGNGPDTSPVDNNPSTEQYFTTETPDTNAPVISNVIVASTTDTTATIIWHTDEPSNSMVQYSAIQGAYTWGNYPLSENDAGMVTSHSVTLTGLIEGTVYYFSVGSTDASGNGPDLNSNATNPSAEDSFITDFTPDTDSPVISNVTVVSATDTTATIIWHTDEPSNSMVQYSAIQGAYTWGNYPLSENDAGMVTSHSVTLTGLTTGTYHFRVGSTDASGNGPDLNSNTTNPSDEYNFTTTEPDTTAPVISNVIVLSTTDTTATITWTTDELSNSMVRYDIVSRSTWGGYQWSKNDAQMATSPHSVTLSGLTKGTTYHFRVGSNDALGNGPPLKVNTTNPSNDNTFDTTNNDIDPPSIIGVHIDYVNDAIDITYDEANMRNANIEANYSFSPNLYFRTAGGSDDITYQGSNTYRLFMSFIPENTGFILTVTGITDQAGNEVDPRSITIGIPSAAGDIKEVIPHNKAGIDDTTRIPHNTSFAARIEDSDGIDTTDPESITFTINDGFLPTIYDYNVGNTDVVRVIQLDPTQNINNLTKLWVVYDRSTDYTYGPVFEFGATVTISVDAKDRLGNWMNQGTYSFKVETEAQYINAQNNLPPTTTTPDSPSPGLTTISVDSGDLVGAQIIFDSYETVSPTFGPLNELSALSISGVNGVGVPMNLQPPTVFDDPVNKPVTIFIPCPGHQYVNALNIYRYTGTSWVLACDVSGNVQPGGEAWMVPGSRVNHNNGSPPTIEIRVYHFTGVQAGSPSSSGGGSTDEAAGGGCFIATAAYGSNMDRHVKILTKFRDKRLVTNSIGRGIIDAYYKFSPPAAGYLRNHPFVRAIVRYALVPVTGIAYILLYIHPLVLLFAFILLLLTGVYCAKHFYQSRLNISQ